MTPFSTIQIASDWRSLARGESDHIASWLRSSGEGRRGLCLLTIFFGVGLYGATIGVWHGPRMAAYVAIKLPLVVCLTLAVNGLINGLFAQLLGSGLGFRQTTEALLMTFAVFALIVGSLSPITFLLAWNAPPPEAPDSGSVHRQLLVAHTFLIAFAGVISVQKLFGIVTAFSGDRSAAVRTLFAWLAGNLFAGAQMGFLFRPIFGTPGLEIAFLRPDAFEGNFYESVWWALRHF